MKKLLLILAPLMLCCSAFSQQINGTINAAASTCTAGVCATLHLPSSAGATSIVLSGTFSATVQFEGSAANDANYAALSCAPINSTTTASSATSTGTWTCNVAGLTDVRVRGSSYVSGNVAVTLNSSPASASSRLAGLPAIAANSDLANTTGSAAVPVATSLPSCPDSSGNHLNYTTNVGYSCGVSFGPGSLPFTPLIQYAMTDCTNNVSCPDTSGNANNCTLTNGTVTAKGLNFGSTGNTVCAIATSRWASVRTILMWYRSAPDANATSNTFQTLFAGDFSAPMEIRYPSGNTALYTASNQTVAASRGLLGDSFLGIVFGATPKIFYGPNEETAYIAQQSFTPSGTPAFFSIGQTGGGQGFKSQMYYFLAFTQTLTASQVSQAYSFVTPILAARGIQVNSGPVNPQILYVGDSITDCAVAATQPCHTFYNSKFLGMTHTNLGVVAQTQAGYTYTATVIPLITQGNTLVLNYLGTNDIAGNASAATTFTALQTNCTAVHAAGGLCVPVTTLPRDVTFSGGQTPGGFETQRLLLATSISGDTTDFDGYADPANDPIIGAGGATTADNTAYYIDKVHPTAIANRFLAAYMTNAMYGALKRGPTCNVYSFSVSGGNWNIGINGSGTIPAAAVAAATTQSVPFFWIQPRSKVASITLKTTTVWSGTGFTSLGVTVGDSVGGATFYTSPSYNLLTAVGATNYADSGSLEKSGGSLGSNLTLQFTANQNLNANALTGALDVTVCMDTRP